MIVRTFEDTCNVCAGVGFTIEEMDHIDGSTTTAFDSECTHCYGTGRIEIDDQEVFEVIYRVSKILQSRPEGVFHIKLRNEWFNSEVDALVVISVTGDFKRGNELEQHHELGQELEELLEPFDMGYKFLPHNQHMLIKRY